jgi:translation initiation factor IF-3
VRINDQIRRGTREIRLIAADGKQVGIVPVDQALEEAESRDLDLVEVAPQAQPPVCRIMDYGKYRYEQTKREREARHHSHQTKTKEVKFRPNISEHDYETKKRHVVEFLQEGDRVKVSCFYRGREAAHAELGVQLVERLIEEVAEFGAVEMPGKRVGPAYSTVLGPRKSQSKH